MESWPATAPEYRIDKKRVAANLDAVRSFMAEKDIDGLIINSADRFQNEYTPLEDNHRYELSGFTGSTALMLILRDQRAKLYVDGRYHLQADQEVDDKAIEVVKVQFSVSLSGALLNDLSGLKKVALEGDRVSIRFSKSIEESVKDTVILSCGEVGKALGRPPLTHAKPIIPIPSDISGRTTAEKLKHVFADIIDEDGAALLVTALDDIAWLTDARGYHFAYQSSFAATALARPEQLFVTVDAEVAATAPKQTGVEYTTTSPVALLASAGFSDVQVLQFDPSQVTRGLIETIKAARPELVLRECASPVVTARAVKTASEIQHMEAANARSSRAITNTIKWVRENLASGREVTELGYYEAANKFYEAEGARDLSFHTIAAVGANTAIIHFSNPSADIVAGPSDFMLLDSGALYEGGFATDITRCFVSGGSLAKPSDRQKLIYTLVLKGLLRGMMAVFPKGTKGAFIDALVRAPIYEAGYDFAHGTGHGVGIHVHEPGVGISPSFQGVIKAGHVCSIEPGIYLPDFGGVRHENVVVFEDDPSHEGFLRSRPLNYVGFDTYLIEQDRLNEQESAYFQAYMEECHKRGTATFE